MPDDKAGKTALAISAAPALAAALPTNAGIVYLARSVLMQEMSIRYGLFSPTILSMLYISGTVTGNFATLLVEQRGG